MHNPDPHPKAPAFQFYPKDWLSDGRVRAMGHEARGIYIDLLSIYWNDGGLPDDIKGLASRVAVPLRTFQRLWPLISPCFETDGNSLSSKRLDREKVKQSEYRSLQQAKGLKSAKSRVSNKDNQPRLNPAEVRLEPDSNSSFASSSSSASTEQTDPGRSVKAETTETPDETPVSDSTEGQQINGVQQIGGENRLTPQALGIRTDPGNFAQVQLSHDLTALVMAIGDPDKDPKSEALALLHAISATPKGVKIETLDLRRVPSNWAAVTTHAAFKLAADHGVDLALVDGWRTARTPANAPEPKAPEMATASTEPRTCALCGGALRSKGGLYICADSLAIGCTWMVRTSDQPALKSNAA